MSQEKLVITPFRHALESLESILREEETLIVRDATIQRFEYTYELSWKMIKRHLEWAGDSNADSLTRKDLFREAARVRLIEDADKWFEYHEARNRTSHTYDAEVAEEVYEAAKTFAIDARRLLTALEAHHG